MTGLWSNNGKTIERVIFFSGLTVPESTTKRTPSMVTEVSAILVAMMHFLSPGGAMSKTLGTRFINSLIYSSSFMTV